MLKSVPLNRLVPIAAGKGGALRRLKGWRGAMGAARVCRTLGRRVGGGLWVRIILINSHDVTGQKRRFEEKLVWTSKEGQH